MTNEEIDQYMEPAVDWVDNYDGLGDAAGEEFVALLRSLGRKLVSQAYEDAAQVADRKAREADEYAERESLPPDHGGDPSIAEEIRALKDALAPASDTTSAEG
jgi:hypothetical protein